MRIATWNLARPRPDGWKRTPRMARQMRAIDADFWVLTETHDRIVPHRGDGSPLEYYACSSFDNGAHGEGERWTMVWSRWPLVPLPTRTPTHAACARIDDSPYGSLIVYGTVLPDGTAKSWEPHYDAIRLQGEDWSDLQKRYPKHRLVVAGDFNQNRGAAHEYGTKDGRALLSEMLAAADLVCVTEGDLVAAGKLRRSQTIDHICISREWAAEVSMAETITWEGREDDGPMSDHNGIAVTLPVPSSVPVPDAAQETV